VDKAVAETDDVLPRDFGIGGARVFGHAAGRLADDFEEANQSEIELAVGIEVGTCFFRAISTASRA
jgi:hypothetical protein